MSTLANSEELMRFIAVTLNGLQLPAKLRSRVASACFGITLEHHHAVTILVSNERMATAFALARPIFESFVRGTWLTHCASDEQVESFADARRPPKIDCLIGDLEKEPGYDGKVLSAIKSSAWGSLCDYTHSGGLPIQRWQTGSSVEPKYSQDEVAEVLAIGNLFASLSAVELVGISGSPEKYEALEKSLLTYLPTKV